METKYSPSRIWNVNEQQQKNDFIKRKKMGWARTFSSFKCSLLHPQHLPEQQIEIHHNDMEMGRVQVWGMLCSVLPMRGCQRFTVTERSGKWLQTENHRYLVWESQGSLRRQGALKLHRTGTLSTLTFNTFQSTSLHTMLLTTWYFKFGFWLFPKFTTGQ